MLEYPGWLLCGFLVPVTLFPTWVTWISWALAPDVGHGGGPAVLGR